MLMTVLLKYRLKLAPQAVLNVMSCMATDGGGRGSLHLARPRMQPVYSRQASSGRG